MYIFRKLILSTLTNNAKFPFFILSFYISLGSMFKRFLPFHHPLIHANMRARFWGKKYEQSRRSCHPRRGKTLFFLSFLNSLSSWIFFMFSFSFRFDTLHVVLSRDFSGLPIINNVKLSKVYFSFFYHFNIGEYAKI